jgi:hypothetical protein
VSVGDLDEYVAAGVVGARDVGSAGGAQPQQGVDRDLAVPGAAQRLAQPGEGGVIEQSPAAVDVHQRAAVEQSLGGTRVQLHAVDGHRRVRTEEPVGGEHTRRLADGHLRPDAGGPVDVGDDHVDAGGGQRRAPSTRSVAVRSAGTRSGPVAGSPSRSATARCGASSCSASSPVSSMVRVTVSQRRSPTAG